MKCVLGSNCVSVSIYQDRQQDEGDLEAATSVTVHVHHVLPGSLSTLVPYELPLIPLAFAQHQAIQCACERD